MTATDQPTDQITDQITNEPKPSNDAELPQRVRSKTAPAHQLDGLDVSPFELIQFMIDSVSDFASLHAAVDLNIFELLSHEELTSYELALACDADPGSTHRLMRWLHSRDFVDTYGQRYQLTELGEALTAAAERSQRHTVLVSGSSYWWDAVRGLADTIRAGQPASPSGLSPYDYLARNPDLGREFDLSADAHSAAVGQDLAAISDFAAVRTIADLGGGLGGVLGNILTEHPHLGGILADREDVLDRARDRLANEGLADRIRLAPGDFFDRIPEGAQIYLLSSVLRTYSDAQCVELLSAVREAMASADEDGAEVWIVEGMLPRLPGARSRWFSTDMRMRALFYGDGVRVPEDFHRLTRQAGFRVHKSNRLPCGQTLMIARADSL
ncbi:methyltransferase [Nonomuraea sp. NPDC026600]|uniref:methyltransferase n=1 Tax=Nonomuraea sp. NPDC026600 TaxID=3155363 RepID=UPI0033D7CD6D